MAVKVTTPFADSPRNGCWGDRPYAVIDLQGPSSYTQMVNGTSPAVPTGGQALTPATFGLVAGIEGIISVSGSLTGTYDVLPVQTTGYYQGMGNPTWALRWTTAATGAEVGGGVDLSGEVVRLIAFGPY